MVLQIIANTKGEHLPLPLKLTSERAYVTFARWFRVILALLYAVLFVYQVLYLSSTLSPGDYEPWEFSMPSTFSVDILSVASINRTGLLEFQRQTLTKHESVRNFFNATEVDDYDPECYKNLTWDKIVAVSTFCRKRRASMNISRELYVLKGLYARMQWLAKKPNPAGWMCAIQRPYAGLRKAYHHYKATRQELPDFFIIFDDDSYYNMDVFRENHQDLNSSELNVFAGCLVRQPLHQLNFTFAFGGFGVVLSKGTLDYLFTPIICPKIETKNQRMPTIANHPNSEAICDQMERDLVKELQYFEQGDSLLDLILKYVNTERYRDVYSWKTGFCMHSDWVMGYFIQYYNASQHVADPFFANVPQARIESYKHKVFHGGQIELIDSEIYAFPKGLCKNEIHCQPGAAICHKPSMEWMMQETRHWKKKNVTKAAPALWWEK